MTARNRWQCGQPTSGVEARQASPAVLLRFGNRKPSILHAQWFKEPAFENVTEWGVFDAGNEEAKEIGRVAVMEERTGLIDQGERSQACNPLIRRDCAINIAAERRLIGQRNGALLKIAIA
jgi:hypothetical protein